MKTRIKNANFLAVGILSLLFFSGCNINKTEILQPTKIPDEKPSEPQNTEALKPDKNNTRYKRFDFSSLSTIFTFSAEIPDSLEAEFVNKNESINIFNPKDVKSNNQDSSQIFIRHFSANSFLTLNTVDILQEEKTTAVNRPAVRYEIKKKENVPNFPNQPLWRNEQHKLIDIRYSDNNPSTFFVFSYNPEFSEKQFERFIQSIEFHNRPEYFSQPISNAKNRLTLKPFGIEVSPENSPVSPEKFSGFHTASDYEVFENENDAEVSIFAICGGKILQKKNATGYGGLLVQSCEIDTQKITVIYGHIKLSSVQKQIGNYLAPGELFAVLGEAYSSETDGERKHLHLGIHKGANIDIRGYVPRELELTNWIDFESL